MLILNAGDDTGSVGIRIKQAFDRHATDWSVRHVRMTDNYARHDADIEGWEPRSLVSELYREADVVHWMEGFGGPDHLDALPISNPKPAVLQHHGEVLRQRHAALATQAAAFRAVELVSTLDLLRFVPDATWLPSPYPLKFFRDLRRTYSSNRPRPVVFHSPTVRARKGTDLLLGAVRQLNVAEPVVDLEIVEQREQAYVFLRKAQADIVFDNAYGYGLNAVEAFAMGIPVLAGLLPSDEYGGEATREAIRRWVGYLPFFEFTAESLPSELAKLVESRPLRNVWGEVGQEYANAYHDERKVVKQLKGIYADAVEKFNE